MVLIAEQQFPDKNELVLATIRKIMPYGAFCILPGYGDVEAFLHISEIAPRWIKNIHEFISEGQKHVMKVHRIDQSRGQIDVSMKRVSDEEKRAKLEQVRSEKRANKLLELSLKTSKSRMKFENVQKEIEKHYEDTYSCFREAMEEGMPALKDVDLPESLKETIVEISKKNIKRPSVTIDGVISLTCYDSDGLSKIKEAFTGIDDSVSVLYLGAPSYKVSITDSDYKTAEKKLSAVVEQIKGFAEKNNCDFGFDRERS